MRMTTLAMTRTGETRTPDMENVFGTRTMSNRYPLSHPSGEVLEASKTRVLRQWEKQQRVWGAQEAKLAAETDKPPQALAMSERRMQEARKRRELVDKYLMAMPMDQRMGEVQWYMSLRDGWTRYVQVGVAPHPRRGRTEPDEQRTGRKGFARAAGQRPRGAATHRAQQ